MKKEYSELVHVVDDFMNKANKKIKDSKWREYYHFMMPSGWINDPCGLIQYKNKYHMFCQHQPYQGKWGQMHWGHAVSDDMINWTMLPEALVPSEACDDWIGGGIFTGSAIEHDGKLILFYTACAEEKQVQCMAISEDGITFKKYENNPIIDITPEDTNPHDFRDPKVWKHEDYWYMVTGGTNGESALLKESTYRDNGYGKVFLHKSKDLKNWEFVSNIVESMGELGTMLECPNFFKLGNKYVLIYSPMGLPKRQCVYLTGDFSYKTGKFNWSVMGEVDWGVDYYAPQMFTDKEDRTLMFGWIGSWPFMPWCNEKYDTSEMGWCGSISLPRELEICDDGKIIFTPAKEVELLRTDKINKYTDVIIDSNTFEFNGGEDNIHCEILLEINLKETTSKKIEIELRGTKNNSTKLIFDLEQGEMIFDRTKSGNIEALIRKCLLESINEDILNVRIFLDSSSVEIFTDNGRTVMTNNIFTEVDKTILSITSIDGNTKLTSLETYGLKKVINW